MNISYPLFITTRFYRNTDPKQMVLRMRGEADFRKTWPKASEDRIEASLVDLAELRRRHRSTCQ